MTYDNFTQKSQDAIQKAQQIAAEMDQQMVETAHLIKGILLEEPSVALFLFNAMGITPAALNTDIDKAIQTFPRVQGSDKQFLTNDANKALTKAKSYLGRIWRTSSSR